MRLSLRSHLVVFATLSLAPAFVAVAAVGYSYVLAEQRTVQEQSRRLAEDFAQNLEREVDAITRTLQALATSPSIDSEDYAAFQKKIESTLPDVSAAITLRKADCQQIVNTLIPFGTQALPKSDDPILLANDEKGFAIRSASRIGSIHWGCGETAVHHRGRSGLAKGQLGLLAGHGRAARFTRPASSTGAKIRRGLVGDPHRY